VPNYHELKSCRAGGGDHLVSVLNLGQQQLTGVFPRSPSEPITKGPLELVWSPVSGLLQLRHSYEPTEMYGANYGYRSGLNQSMVDHLTLKVRFLEKLVAPDSGDVVLDIGSNDGTTLKAYSRPGLRRVGIDPTIEKFRQFYPPPITAVADFFSADVYHKVEQRRARIVTSIAMFYDLESPVDFVREIAKVLAPDGVWHFEQSYMPTMLRTTSYDTICHEHLEYYSLGAVTKILDAADMKVVDVLTNGVNGGSFAVTATHRSNNSIRPSQAVVDWLLEQEERMGLATPKPFREFEERVFRHRQDLVRLIHSLVADGKKVLGYGASTKGNVLLQFCGFSAREIPAIAEVNPDKFGCVTPGSHIPIIPESEARAANPDYFLVLPWHFKDGIVRRERDFILGGGKLILPFPEIEIV
jgi:SAM-dependent methyltransferase